MKFGANPKTFNLLSIGQRGVGKTVFLAGSYAELRADPQDNACGDSRAQAQLNRPRQLWLDCQERQARENLERLLDYIARTGQYPPLTIKITNFNFSLQRHNQWGDKTLCRFRWWDVPGESCNIHNYDFNKIVATSHGCCVFIDAYELTYNHKYLQALKDIITQVAAIASLVSLNRLKYAFAIILTKCDLLEPNPLSQQQLQQRLQPLLARLDAMRVNYQTFYSFIPIVHTEAGATLKAKGTAAPLLWLVRELSQQHNPAWLRNPLNSISRLLPRPSQMQQRLAAGGLRSLLWRPHKVRAKNFSHLSSSLSPTQRNVLFLSLIGVSLTGVLGTLAIQFGWFATASTKNLQVLERRQQLEHAIFLTEKLIQQQPKLVDLRLQLARLYELTGQVTRAETVYDQVLAQQPNNLDALVGKALLRHTQGDDRTATALFAQAERNAPTERQAQISDLAHKTLQSSQKSVPTSKF
ncbi:MAG: tetratricopeptide repeat protein [Chroococcidiopsidaceae cyanobacterium CP_BM_ER_R8_30]|nr:tetratricopeptide repeat protein [Chroococcidiopsidaceae cyanobacterium CP_BM_ER_R8_30]